MKFMNKLCRGYEIASVTQALTFKDVYIFDAKLKAPRLLEIDTLEEVECPLVEIQVSENTIQLPSNWHVMIFETENFTIDTIPVALSQVYENMTPGFQFNATDGILQNIVPKKLPMIDMVQRILWYSHHFRNIWHFLSQLMKPLLLSPVHMT